MFIVYYNAYCNAYCNAICIASKRCWSTPGKILWYFQARTRNNKGSHSKAEDFRRCWTNIPQGLASTLCIKAGSGTWTQMHPRRGNYIIPVEVRDWATLLVCIPKTDENVCLCGDYKCSTNRSVPHTYTWWTVFQSGGREVILKNWSEKCISTNVIRWQIPRISDNKHAQGFIQVHTTSIHYIYKLSHMAKIHRTSTLWGRTCKCHYRRCTYNRRAQTMSTKRHWRLFFRNRDL